MLKMFSKSRLTWSLPGGFILSALVCECYQSDYHRDDVAFYNTIVAIKNRLELSTDVYNPVHTSQLLNHDDKTTKKIERLKSELKSKLDKLDDLFEYTCDEKQARKAWKSFFKHNYWSNEEVLSEMNLEKASINSFNADGFSLEVDVNIYFRKDGPIALPLVYGIHYIPKKKWIKFYAKHNISEPYTVEWEVYNYGDEAEEANDTHHKCEMNNTCLHWESTKYRGPHIMICAVKKNGITLAREVVNIDIA